MKTMKQFSLTLLLIAATICVNATVRTVSNSPAGGAQYNSLLAAYNAAVNGDTLLLEGTNIDYAHTYVSGHWNKSLTVIGIGYRPGKQNPLLTRIAAFNDNYYNVFKISASGSGSKFYGIYFIGAYEYSISGSSVNNLVFVDCKFDAGFQLMGNSISGISFTNCVFDTDNNTNFSIGGTGNAVSGLSFTNCVFDGFLQGSSNNMISLVIDHCLFLSTTQVPLQNIHNATIHNSIFMNYATVQSGTSVNNIFNNNVNRLGSMPSGTNNQNSVNPNFVTYTLGSLYSTSHNYNLQSGSPAILAGSDGTDIGVNGGFSNFNESGEVLINPIVREVNIMNTTVQPNGTMNVQVRATKPNDQ